RRIYKFDNNKTYSIFEDINRRNRETLRIICDVAKTQILKKILFMLFVCIITTTPNFAFLLFLLIYLFKKKLYNYYSKPFGIEKRWKQAKYLENDKTKSILLLDELGLEERSLFKNPDISFVGLSNWLLDAIKMNRVVMHRILNPTSKNWKTLRKKYFCH
ncbi:hypothetical protein RFI_29946, partial [Reticulomyxa filosa]